MWSVCELIILNFCKTYISSTTYANAAASRLDKTKKIAKRDEYHAIRW